jgi:hypothetical protein
MSEKQPTNGELAIMLKNIEQMISEVHKKQDYTNGNVMRNTEFRLKSEAIISLVKWIGFSQIITIFYLVGTLLVK